MAFGAIIAWAKRGWAARERIEYWKRIAPKPEYAGPRIWRLVRQQVPWILLPGSGITAVWLLAATVPRAGLFWWQNPVSGSAEQLELQYRQQFLHLLAGFGGFVAILLTFEKLKADRDGKVTDRLIKAVEQVGSDVLALQLGGVYGLERVGKDSDRDAAEVVDLIRALIRQRAQRAGSKTNPPLDDAEADSSNRDPGIDKAVIERQFGALSELARQGHRPKQAHPFDQLRLQGLNLADTVLGECTFAGSDLVDVEFRNADLRGSKFIGTRLRGVHFEGARLDGCTFQRVDATGCTFDGGTLVNTIWTGCTLRGVTFRRSYCARAEFSGLEGSALDFDGAKLWRTKFAKSKIVEAGFRRVSWRNGGFEGEFQGAKFAEAGLMDTIFQGKGSEVDVERTVSGGNWSGFEAVRAAQPVDGPVVTEEKMAGIETKDLDRVPLAETGRRRRSGAS